MIKYCSECGSKLNIADNFCGECGNKINFFTETNIEDINAILKANNEYEKIQKKYEHYINRHYDIINEIQFKLYPNAINDKNIFNKYASKCIKLGYEDMEIAPYIIMWQKEIANFQKKEYIPLNYGSHKYLIKILEKQKKYDEAISICDIYINYNLIDDGTKSGIIGRKERLISLKNKI